MGTTAQGSDGRRSWLRVGILLVVLVLVGAVLLERAIVTDAERLDLLFDELAEALAGEDEDAMDRLLADPFSYSGPRPLGDGDRDRSMQKLREFWRDTSDTRVTSRSREVLVEGSVGVIQGSGNLRFSWSDSMVLYKITFEIAALKTDDGWKAQGVRLTELSPGLF
jgi:hypothetical protein